MVAFIIYAYPTQVGFHCRNAKFKLHLCRIEFQFKTLSEFKFQIRLNTRGDKDG